MVVTRRIISQVEHGNLGGESSPASSSNCAENNRAASEDLDKITHDIRSAINIIIGYAQLMLDETTGKINARQRRALQDILNSSNKLSNLADVISRRLEAESGRK